MKMTIKVTMVSAENRKIRPAKAAFVMGGICFTSDGIMLDIPSM